MSAPTMSAVPTRSKMDTKTITSLAMLTGVSVIIAWMSKLMPPVMFLDFDFKHVVVCIGGFTFGPFAAAQPPGSTRKSAPSRGLSLVSAWAWLSWWR